mmetsp:Transcript_63185/g.206203  ORF Transcript_63185/g.206203 Transcript_63185/m.206203 type:complete len:233 (+) Transcript_63185:1668-2366(+)
MNLDRVRHARSHAQSQVGAEIKFFLEHCLELRRDIWRLVVYVEPLQQLLKDCWALRLPRHHLSDEVLAPTAVHSQVPPHWVRELTLRGVPLGALLPKLDALDAALDDTRHEDEVKQHRKEELEVNELSEVQPIPVGLRHVHVHVCVEAVDAPLECADVVRREDDGGEETQGHEFAACPVHELRRQLHVLGTVVVVVVEVLLAGVRLLFAVLVGRSEAMTEPMPERLKGQCEP